MARQDDGSLPPFPIWDDVRTFDGKPWRGLVDCVSGGFPCKGGSAARTNNPKRTTGTGLGHAESALWHEQCRIIREVEPTYVRVENSPNLHRHGLGTVLGDLAAMGFDAEWDLLSAAFVGAPHERKRTWLVATHPDRAQRTGGELSCRAHSEQPYTWRDAWWQNRPIIHRVDDVVAKRVDRLVCTGNGQVPAVGAIAWKTLGNFC